MFDIEKIKEENRSLLSQIQEEQTEKEMLDYFRKQVLQETDCKDIAVAWKIYKERYNI